MTIIFALVVLTAVLAFIYPTCGASESAVVDRYERFHEWFSGHGGRASRIGIDLFGDMGFGIAAREHISSGTEILRIPLSITFSASSLAKSADALHRELAAILPSEEAVIMSVALEKVRGSNSAFEPYISMLPSYVSSLTHFSSEELELLNDNKLAANARQHQQLKRRLYDSNIAKLSDSAIPSDTLAKIDFYMYVWASTIVDSRGLRFSGKVYLAPFSDFFNYKPHPEMRKALAGQFYLTHHELRETDSDDGVLIVKADRSYSSVGEQVFEDYGDNDDHIYIMYHGFVPETNPFRCHGVQGLPFDSLSEHTRDFLRSLGFSGSAAPQSCLRPQAGEELDKGLEVYLTAISMTEKQMDECSEQIEVIKQHNQPIHRVYVACGLGKAFDNMKALLASLRTTENKRELLQRFATTHEGRILDNLQQTIKNASVNRTGNVLNREKMELQQINQQITKAEVGSSVWRHLVHTSIALRYRIAMKETLQQLEQHYLIDSDLSEHVDRASIDTEVEVDVSGAVTTTGASTSASTSTSTASKESESELIELQREIDEFNTWFRQAVQDATIDGSKEVAACHIEAALIPMYRIGTLATQPIQAEEVYVGVPSAIILDADKAAADFYEVDSNSNVVSGVGQLIQALQKKYKNRDSFHELLFFLLSEKFIKREASQFYQYLRLLPTSKQLDIPLLWSLEQVHERLAPSDIVSAIIEYHEKVRKAFEFLIGVEEITHFFTLEINGSVANILSYENYLWANAILDSRSIWWQGQRHLVPMLDFVNCKEGPDPSRVHATATETIPFKSQSIDIAVTKAPWSFQQGEQVFENYGQPNHIYFMYHGFVLADDASGVGNTHDCLYTEFHMAEEELDALTNRSVAIDLGKRLGVRDIYSHHTCVSSLKDIRFATWFFVAMKANDVDTFIAARGKPSEAMLGYFKNLLSEKLTRYAAHSTSHSGSANFLQTEVNIVKQLLKSLPSK